MELIYIIDTSGSMYSNRIAAVNAVLTECVSVIRNHIKRYDTEVSVRYMTFNDSVSELYHIGDVQNDGFPDFEVKASGDFYPLTRFETMYEGIIGCLADRPGGDLGIILITDGKPVDSLNYQGKLEKAKSLDQFRNAVRLVACVERDPLVSDQDLLEFVGFKADRIVELSRLPIETEHLISAFTDEKTCGSGPENDFISVFD
ncbi:MAG: hypothetical protein K5886_04370 [Lachnospiraceae bacterium]|nr:hypothetical protein [Lachnospiraceae bacterium]